jgi:hypothetical protein
VRSPLRAERARVHTCGTASQEFASVSTLGASNGRFRGSPTPCLPRSGTAGTPAPPPAGATGARSPGTRAAARGSVSTRETGSRGRAVPVSRTYYCVDLFMCILQPFIWENIRFLVLSPLLISFGRKLGFLIRLNWDHENLLEMLLSCWLDIFLYSVCACMERDIEIFLRKNPINLIIIIRLSKKSCYRVFFGLPGRSRERLRRRLKP